MHIQDLLARSQPTLSLEFFPPRTEEAASRFTSMLAELAPWQPGFVSITYGAGGSTRHLTAETVRRIRQRFSWEVIPHLTGIGHTRREVNALLEDYAAQGVSNLLALRGDAPRGEIASGSTVHDFPYAIDLVRAIRQFNETGHHPAPRGFGIGVAAFPEGHPSAPNRLLEMDHLRAKVDAGADYLCTQLFFDNHDFRDFRERCALAGIHAPILAGLLPVTTLAGLRRMAELAPRTRFPARLLHLAAKWEHDPASFRAAGLDYTIQQASELLLDQVDGLHLYTLNQSTPTTAILRALPLRSRFTVAATATHAPSVAHTMPVLLA